MANEPETDSSTPTPWEIASEKLDGHLDFPIVDATGEQIAGAHFRATASTSDEESWTKKGQPQAWANANLIVRAVNNHAKLLKALVNLMNYLADPANPKPGLGAKNVFRNARTAIKEATE